MMPRDPVNAPDGRTWYETALAEAEKRGQLQDQVSHLRAAVFDMAETAIAGFRGDMDESDALSQINNRGRKILGGHQ